VVLHTEELLRGVEGVVCKVETGLIFRHEIDLAGFCQSSYLQAG
jgi:hypothetical protein